MEHVQTLPPILTIAGSDSGGGAGIQADLKTIQALGGYGMSAITAITAQNTNGVFGVQEVSLEMIKQQIELVLSDIGAAAIKTGMLANAEIIETVVGALTPYSSTPLTVDPVMIAKGGASLLADEAVDTLKTKLLPMATIVTPNIPEAECISGLTIKSKEDMQQAAKIIQVLGTQHVIIKGGHLDLGDGLVHNLLLTHEGQEVWQQSPRIDTKNTHGTGCTFSAAIATLLGHGDNVEDAFKKAEAYVAKAIETAPNLGHGHGPLNHMHPY